MSRDDRLGGCAGIMLGLLLAGGLWLLIWVWFMVGVWGQRAPPSG